MRAGQAEARLGLELTEGEVELLQAARQGSFAHRESLRDALHRRGPGVGLFGDGRADTTGEVVAGRKLVAEAARVIFENGGESRVGVGDRRVESRFIEEDSRLRRTESNGGAEHPLVLGRVRGRVEGELDGRGTKVFADADRHPPYQRREGVLLRGLRNGLTGGGAHHEARGAVAHLEARADVDEGEVGRDAAVGLGDRRAVRAEKVHHPVRTEGQGFGGVEREVRIVGAGVGRREERVGVRRGEAAIGVEHLVSGEPGGLQERFSIEAEPLVGVEDRPAGDGEDGVGHGNAAYPKRRAAAVTKSPKATRPQSSGNQSPRTP